MKRILWIAPAILFLFSTIIAKGGRDESSYRVRIDPGSNRMLVSAELTLEDGVLSVSGIGAEQFDRRWANFISNLKVTGADGRDVPVSESETGWKLDAMRGERVKIGYEVSLDHEKHEWPAGIDGAAYVRDWGIFSVGRAYAVTNGADRKNINVSFSLPEGWSVSASWKKNPDGSFTAADNGALSESMIFAGTHKEFRIARDGFELEFAIGGPGVVEKEAEFAKLSEGVLDYYIGLMGGIPKPPPGISLDKVLVVISPGKSTDGEVIGTHISMILDTSGDPMGALVSRFIFAHELFHLWNGRSIIPESANEEWFKEGVSNYYTMKALRNAGVINDTTLFGVLNGLFFQRYSKDEAYGKRSINEVSSGDDKHRHWGMIYGGGLFAGMCRDVAIRKATGNGKSLDDVITGLFKDFGGSAEQYSRKELLSRISGNASDTSGFFEKYVYGAAPVPIDSCLRDAGFRAEIKEGQLMVSRKTDESPEEKKMIDEMLGGQ